MKQSTSERNGVLHTHFQKEQLPLLQKSATPTKFRAYNEITLKTAASKSLKPMPHLDSHTQEAPAGNLIQFHPP
jgi:hypothetical protein